MSATPRVLALVPARSGSKSVPDKNLRDHAGKPLLAHSIEHALVCPGIDRVIVSTDSPHYAEVARAWGAETPFLRPPELAADDSTDLEAFLHALDWLRDHEAWEPDIVVHLRPTYPDRDPRDIEAMLELLIGDPTLDSVRSVAPAPATPYKMWTRADDGLLTPVADLDCEAWNAPRQRLPAVYLQNACIDAVRSRVLREQGSMTGRRIHGYLMTADHDVDTHADLERLGAGGPRRRHFRIALDGVLAHAAENIEAAEPRRDVVAAVERLHAAGHRITVHAAERAPEPVARAWLQRWAVPFDSLECSAAAGSAADYLVDTRALDLATFLEIAAALAPRRR